MEAGVEGPQWDQGASVTVACTVRRVRQQLMGNG